MSQMFLDLRHDFDTGVAIHTATVSFRIHESVSILGEEHPFTVPNYILTSLSSQKANVARA